MLNLRICYIENKFFDEIKMEFFNRIDHLETLGQKLISIDTTLSIPGNDSLISSITACYVVE